MRSLREVVVCNEMGRDFVFISGLDQSYSPHKRAFVRMKAGQRKRQPRIVESDRGLSIVFPIDGRSSDTQYELKDVRLTRTSVDDSMMFDPFDSFAQRLDRQAQSLVANCEWEHFPLRHSGS